MTNASLILAVKTRAYFAARGWRKWFLHRAAWRDDSQTQRGAATLRAPSPLNEERAGVRGGKAAELRPHGEPRSHHPSPSFPLPVEERGRLGDCRAGLITLVAATAIIFVTLNAGAATGKSPREPNE